MIRIWYLFTIKVMAEMMISLSNHAQRHHDQGQTSHSQGFVITALLGPSTRHTDPEIELLSKFVHSIHHYPIHLLGPAAPAPGIAPIP